MMMSVCPGERPFTSSPTWVGIVAGRRQVEIIQLKIVRRISDSSIDITVSGGQFSSQARRNIQSIRQETTLNTIRDVY
jgi:hypothetical protein